MTTRIKETFRDNGQVAKDDAVEATRPRIPETAPAANPFDPERFRLGQDFAQTLGVRKKLLIVPVRKPSGRTSPGSPSSKAATTSTKMGRRSAPHGSR